MPPMRCAGAFSKAHDSLDAFYRNFGFFGIGYALKGLFFPFGRPCKAQPPSDDLIRSLGQMIMEPSSVRDALAEPAYISPGTRRMPSAAWKPPTTSCWKWSPPTWLS